jgi:hypothetical protein
MLKIENTEVIGWEAAIRGMRNPMNSWEKSDSGWTTDGVGNNDILVDTDYEGYCELKVGPDDQKLMQNLRNAGTDHRKFMRMITVYLDITAPLYWWKEFDTYKVGTVANSCSTMHKIAAKEFTLEDFSHEHLLHLDETTDLSHTDIPLIGLKYSDEDGDILGSLLKDSVDVMNLTIDMLNKCRKKFLETNNKDYWWQMIQLLPSSYNQRRTIMLNYEVLANIYKSRRNHKLDEWHTLCDWIEGLPYSELITGRRGEI